MTTFNPLKRSIEKVLLILVVISIFILLLPTKAKLQFTNQTSNILLYPIIFLSGRLIELKLLNRDLSTITDQLNRTLITLNRLRMANDSSMTTNAEIIPALVIMRDMETRVRLLTIDRGQKDAIKKGLPVCYEGHLIGRVIESNVNQSIIETIFNPGFRVSVQHLKTRTNGILETTNDKIGIKYISRTINIQPGDTIVTSGIGSFAPPGLLIGKIDVAKSGDGLFFQELRLLPFKNIGGLTHIYILTSK